jgi:transcriptional regulator
MFVQDDYKPRNSEFGYKLIEDIVFGTLVTGGPDLDASHIPFMLDRTRGVRGTLVAHLDRRNPQCEALRRSDAALVSFLGPNSYVSPAWYKSTPHVPTWYYVAVQVRGRVTPVSDAQSLTDMVCQLSRMMEPGDSPWRPEQVSSYTARLVNGIVGFEISIEDMQTQVRVGQQNSKSDRADIRAALAAGNSHQRELEDWIANFEKIEARS